jgi:hypothetical protein
MIGSAGRGSLSYPAELKIYPFLLVYSIAETAALLLYFFTKFNPAGRSAIPQFLHRTYESNPRM